MFSVSSSCAISTLKILLKFFRSPGKVDCTDFHLANLTVHPDNLTHARLSMSSTHLYCQLSCTYALLLSPTSVHVLSVTSSGGMVGLRAMMYTCFWKQLVNHSRSSPSSLTPAVTKAQRSRQREDNTPVVKLRGESRAGGVLKSYRLDQEENDLEP